MRLPGRARVLREAVAGFQAAFDAARDKEDPTAMMRCMKQLMATQQELEDLADADPVSVASEADAERILIEAIRELPPVRIARIVAAIQAP